MRGFRWALAFLLIAGAAASAPCTSGWDRAVRTQFYKLDQGSQMIPLAWAVALRQADGTAFMAGDLARYGFLPNDADPGLPIGFTVARGASGIDQLGLNCAACHTRAIQVGATRCIIDGGPAFADFQRFAADLGAAVASVLPEQPGFGPFAERVLGAGASDSIERSQLGHELDVWYAPYRLWIDAMPSGGSEHWGPARMDAISMIFNRLIGLDLGLNSVDAERNVEPATAPVRYPFLWNAWRQDYTQWTRFAPNTNADLALARNLGQVYGVFAKFKPRAGPGGVDYRTGNSANFAGLMTLEALTKTMPVPKFSDFWPADDANAIDESLAHDGEKVFDTTCASCHGKATAADIWSTGPNPLAHGANTDSRALEVVNRDADTGVLGKAGVLPAQTTALMVLEMVVRKTLEGLSPNGRLVGRLIGGQPIEAFSPVLERAAEMTPTFYEARVLDGIWAAAPYLHNGSVATLADLLTPSQDRPRSFAIGPNYDPVKVGLDSDQDESAFVLTTTGCEDRRSGRSRCGHEYGTTLPTRDKKALLEYLKAH